MTDLITDTLKVDREPTRPFSFSMPFWEASRDRKLLLQFCTRTRKYQFFPRPNSLSDGRLGLEWREASGKGSVYTYTIVRKARGPFAGHEPFIIATVTLDEGVNVVTNIVNCDARQINIGLRVKAYWHPVSNGTHILMFEPDN